MKRVKVFDDLEKICRGCRLKLIPFSLMVTLSGCSMAKSDVALANVSIAAGIFKDAEELIEETQEINYYFKSWGYKCSNLDGNYYRLKEDLNTNTYYCDSIEEFRKFVDVKNPTYDDVKEAIRTNENINDKYKEWLLTGVNNLENSCNDFDLTILYYNINRLIIMERSSEEMYSIIGSSGANFDYINGIVNIDISNVTPYVLCHEVFGHGLSDAVIEKDGKSIFYMPSFSTIYMDLDNADYRFHNLGLSLEEGKADLISDIATNTHGGGPYDMEAEQLRIFLEMTDITLADFSNKGVLFLIKSMIKNDIDEPIDYILSVDGILDSVRNRKFEFPSEYRMKNNMKAFFKDYADDKIEEGLSIETIKGQISRTFENSTYEFVLAGDFFIYDDVEMNELKLEVFEEIDNIKVNQKKNR